jgi:hypothetical protein
MNVSFRIFGAPYVLDIYNGNEKDIAYFQMYDDASNEKVKLTIHRMTTSVSYTYLRYHLISSSGRTGAFFGMSLIFQNHYCSDIESLYKLLDAVYQNILTNGILLEAIQGSSISQAKFNVEKFEKVPTEIARIESIISNNLAQYTEDIHPIDNSFKYPTTGVKRLFIEAKNDEFLAALRQSQWVTISPEYKPNEIDGLSPEDITKLKDNIKSTREEITKIMEIALLKSRVVSDNEIINIGKKLTEQNTIIKTYLKKQPELSEINTELQRAINSYNAVSTNINTTTLNQSISKGSFSLKIITTEGGSAEGDGIYRKKDKVKLIAIPKSGYQFVSWKDNGKALSSSISYYYKMPGNNVEIIAEFKKKEDLNLFFKLKKFFLNFSLPKIEINRNKIIFYFTSFSLIVLFSFLSIFFWNNSDKEHLNEILNIISEENLEKYPEAYDIIMQIEDNDEKYNLKDTLNEHAEKLIKNIISKKEIKNFNVAFKYINKTKEIRYDFLKNKLITIANDELGKIAENNLKEEEYKKYDEKVELLKGISTIHSDIIDANKWKFIENICKYNDTFYDGKKDATIRINAFKESEKILDSSPKSYESEAEKKKIEIGNKVINFYISKYNNPNYDENKKNNFKNYLEYICEKIGKKHITLEKEYDKIMNKK